MAAASSSAAALVERVRTHFIKPATVQTGGRFRGDELLPGAIVLTEVPSPGATARRIDALVVGLTSARAGLDGFEVKVSRSDWLHELDQPRKADAWFRHTHRWWVLAPSTAIVHPEELPEGWGLMVPNPRSAQRLKPVVKAATRTPSLDWPVMWEISKKIDRIRADEVNAAAEAVRRHVHDETRREVERVAAWRHGPDSDAAQLGYALAEVTGAQPWELRLALEQGSDWTRQALGAVFAAARATRRRGDHTGLLEAARRQEAEHVDTAHTLRTAIAALAELDAPGTAPNRATA